ncbi:MAG: bicyclomycin resistance protein [Betaproteobacteria bacterium]|nr:MAG: bicyclomycin resistance protein [Betaproteobacteria bacterium]
MLRSNAKLRMSAAILALVFFATPALGEKVLRYAFLVAETGFDPVQINDLYSSNIIAHIFDPPLDYDYLARPSKVKPNTAAALPEVSADGKTWTVRIRKGIYFADDPAFRGKQRELTAQDYVYSVKRHFDPKSKSPNFYLLDKRIVGMDALRKEALAGGKFDYDREVEGLKAIDRYTFRIVLTEPTPNMLYFFTYCNLFCAVAREVIDAYPDQTMEHPVGTGPFRLAQWKRSSRIVLERNPNYRVDTYDAEPPANDPESQAIAQRMRGKRLPQLDRVEVYIVEEAQPRWLAFLNGEHDLITAIPAEFVNIAVPEGKLAPNLQKKNIQMHRTSELDLTYAYFNMDDPVVGGYTPERVALRRAIALAYDADETIRAIYRGQAIPAQSTVPPGAYGAPKDDLAGPLAEYNPAKAKALLDTYGYVDRDGDGYRERPDGSKLILQLATTPDSQGKQNDELWRKFMDRVGLRIEFRKAKWPEHLRDSRAGKLMMWSLGWSATIPDADTFYVILYGPNKGQSNQARFDLPAWNVLYDKAKVLPDGAERDALYREMDRLFYAYAPLRPITHRIITGLAHPWVVGYRRHPVMREFWKYLDIDEQARSGPSARAAAAAPAPAR